MAQPPKLPQPPAGCQRRPRRSARRSARRRSMCTRIRRRRPRTWVRALRRARSPRRRRSRTTNRPTQAIRGTAASSRRRTRQTPLVGMRPRAMPPRKRRQHGQRCWTRAPCCALVTRTPRSWQRAARLPRGARRLLWTVSFWAASRTRRRWPLRTLRLRRARRCQRWRRARSGDFTGACCAPCDGRGWASSSPSRGRRCRRFCAATRAPRRWEATCASQRPPAPARPWRMCCRWCSR
mmetsp:Transcript_13906/g.44566  ORF Transcript_13906/g.44566 Transcript_13906/m.44566 type:complete len:237 (+) Transcript_13906:140-850(+)